jgi:hypothetical protein
MRTQTTPDWIHPADFVRRRRWAGPVGPAPTAALPQFPRIV